jgi:hypothetical protein
MRRIPEKHNCVGCLSTKKSKTAECIEECIEDCFEECIGECIGECLREFVYGSVYASVYACVFDNFVILSHKSVFLQQGHPKLWFRIIMSIIWEQCGFQKRVD